MSEYDISTNTKRSFTIAKPIHIPKDDHSEEVFYGAIIWESMNLTKIFYELIVPKSFINGKNPFI